MRFEKFLFVIGALVLLGVLVGAYSTYGAPSEFGNETTTTCYVGGDNGIVNCTGNITGKYLLANVSWNYLQDYPVACPSGYAVTQIDDSITCTRVALMDYPNVGDLNITGNVSIGSLTNGSVLFYNGNEIDEDNSNFFWDDVNKRLGIGTTSPSGRFHVNTIGSENALVVNDSTGNVGIGTTAPGAKLEVYTEAQSSSGVLNIHNMPNQGVCSEGMVYVNKLNGFCIDKYEASVWNANGSWNAESSTSTWNAADTDVALAAGAYANSSEGKYPWVYVDQTEARTACANYPGGNKHLCTDEEWLAASNIKGEYFNLALELTDCTVNEATDCDWADSPGAGDACMTGSKTDCVSSEGVYDMTGNVWEWTNETVGYTKPCNAGVSGWCYWNGTGFQTGTDANTAVYGNDGVYFLDNSTVRTGRAVLRGGAWIYGAFAGPFCADLGNAPAGTYGAVGFRCCSS